MNTNHRRLIVTHRSPDLDAITSCWLLKNFDSQKHGSAKFAFVDAGSRISEDEATLLGFEASEISHVDTGLGRFDHHDPVRGAQYTCAAEQVWNYLIEVHPELEQDKALRVIVDYVLQIDHFRDAYWPEAADHRYLFMIQEIIRGMDFSLNHDDQAQVTFGMQMLGYIYAAVIHQVKAEEIIAQKGQIFNLKVGQGIAMETRNDETVRLAQKQGYLLAIRKDPERGNIRIKCRPDSPFDLLEVYEAIIKLDQIGTWFYHPSGKMVLNGSNKNPHHSPSPLKLKQVIEIVKNKLGNIKE